MRADAADDDVDVDGEAVDCHRFDDVVAADVDGYGVDDVDDVEAVVDVMVALLSAVSLSLN